MLAIYLYREGERTQRITSDADEVVLGSSGDIALAGPKVSGRHCKLVLRPAGCFLVQEDGKVLVNGKPLEKATPLYATDKVFVGDYTFMIELLDRAPHPHEDKLLAEIAAGDDASRMVYADWLEENGDIRRAEFLRCQEELAARPQPPIELTRRLRQLATLVDLEWRMKVARVAVEGCRAELRFDFQCPQQWSDLGETESPEVRFCNLCRAQVFYCASVAEARTHAWHGRCVAVDITNERTKNDLARMPAKVGMIVPWTE